MEWQRNEWVKYRYQIACREGAAERNAPRRISRAGSKSSMLPSGAAPDSWTLADNQLPLLFAGSSAPLMDRRAIARRQPVRHSPPRTERVDREFADCVEGLQIRAIDIYEK
jgi:hypothetical protein